MRNFILTIAIIISASIFGSAQNFQEAMRSNIQKLYQTQDATSLATIANTFERIGQKENTQWLPYYYAAYAYTSILFFSNELSADEKNSHLDKAQQKLDKALKVNDTESETYALQALIYSMRITDPSLGYKFSTLSNSSLSKAKTLNPKNPRIYYLHAMNLFYTPAEYGGGSAIAKPLFEKADSIFKLNNTNNKLLPLWGKDQNTMFLNKCQ